MSWNMSGINKRSAYLTTRDVLKVIPEGYDIYVIGIQERFAIFRFFEKLHNMYWTKVPDKSGSKASK